MSSLPRTESVELEAPGIPQVSARLKPELFKLASQTEPLRIREVSVEKSGLIVNHVEVSDGYEAHPSRLEVQNLLNAGEEYLKEHPEATADPASENPIRDGLDSFPAVHAWKQLMPSAKALYPLQRPDALFLPDEMHTPVDEESRELFRHSLDAVGIRTRAKIMEWLSVQQAREENAEDMKWVSLACGAAVPVFDALKTINHEVPDKKVELTLVDIDQGALDFARSLAEGQELQEGEQYKIEAANLVKELVFTEAFVERHGEESFDMVDMLGIFEYFDEERAAKLLRNAYKLVKPGGKLVLGNMLLTHPNLHVNQSAIGWPSIKPRSLEEISSILVKADIPIDASRVYIPEDGVYAVVAVEKQVAESYAPEDRELALATVHSLHQGISKKSA